MPCSPQLTLRRPSAALMLQAGRGAARVQVKVLETTQGCSARAGQPGRCCRPSSLCRARVLDCEHTVP